MRNPQYSVYILCTVQICCGNPTLHWFEHLVHWWRQITPHQLWCFIIKCWGFYGLNSYLLKTIWIKKNIPFTEWISFKVLRTFVLGMHSVLDMHLYFDMHTLTCMSNNWHGRINKFFTWRWWKHYACHIMHNDVLVLSFSPHMTEYLPFSLYLQHYDDSE